MDIILIIYIFIALIIFTKYSDCYTPCERSIMMAILWPLYTAWAIIYYFFKALFIFFKLFFK